MDTNDLSQETYNGIIRCAENFNHDLAHEFKVMAIDCDTDNEFLGECGTLIKEWFEEGDLEDLIEDLFFENLPSKKYFKKTLDKIVKNIETIRNIPMEKRKFDL